jgi:hypothetical protein
LIPEEKHMKTRLFLAALAVLVALPSFAANDEMRKLDFLVGEWTGEATVQIGARPERVLQTENVQAKLDGKVLFIEGLGRRKNADGTAGDVVHNAMAVISWNEAKKNYRFATWLANRPDGEATMEVSGPNQAKWWMDTPNGGKMRYTISLTESGEWLETGEFSQDGVKFVPFFETRLKKVK